MKKNDESSVINDREDRENKKDDRKSDTEEWFTDGSTNHTMNVWMTTMGKEEGEKDYIMEINKKEKEKKNQQQHEKTIESRSPAEAPFNIRYLHSSSESFYFVVRVLKVKKEQEEKDEKEENKINTSPCSLSVGVVKQHEFQTGWNVRGMFLNANHRNFSNGKAVMSFGYGLGRRRRGASNNGGLIREGDSIGVLVDIHKEEEEEKDNTKETIKQRTKIYFYHNSICLGLAFNILSRAKKDKTKKDHTLFYPCLSVVFGQNQHHHQNSSTVSISIKLRIEFPKLTQLPIRRYRMARHVYSRSHHYCSSNLSSSSQAVVEKLQSLIGEWTVKKLLLPREEEAQKQKDEAEGTAQSFLCSSSSSSRQDLQEYLSSEIQPLFLSIVRNEKDPYTLCFSIRIVNRLHFRILTNNTKNVQHDSSLQKNTKRRKIESTKTTTTEEKEETSDPNVVLLFDKLEYVQTPRVITGGPPHLIELENALIQQLPSVNQINIRNSSSSKDESDILTFSGSKMKIEIESVGDDFHALTKYNIKYKIAQCFYEREKKF